MNLGTKTNKHFNIQRKIPHILRNIMDFFFNLQYCGKFCALPITPFHGCGVPRGVKNFMWSLHGWNVLERWYRQQVAGQTWEEPGRSSDTTLTCRPTLQPKQPHTHFIQGGSFSEIKWPILRIRGIIALLPCNNQRHAQQLSEWNKEGKIQ